MCCRYCCMATRLSQVRASSPNASGSRALRGYRAGGTIHFIVNNQIGFTTAPKFSRSSPYPSDIAKGAQAPIFHCNGDDPEAVVYAAKVATEFRQKFGLDVVIDMFCYRRFGHNEGDEPSFTQPLMYKKIRGHKTTRAIYADRLEGEGVISPAFAEEERKRFKDFLESEFNAADAFKPNKADWLDGQWSGFVPPMDDDRRGDTAVEVDVLKKIGERITSYPEGFKVHKTLARVLEDRRASVVEKGADIDWATAEALALGSLVLDGFGVRLSGQDTRRGTFSPAPFRLHRSGDGKDVHAAQSFERRQGDIRSPQLQSLGIRGPWI